MHHQLKPLFVEAQCPNRSSHEGELLDVVRSLNINHAIKAAPEFFAVIGDIRKQVSGFTAALDDYAVAVQTHLDRSQPNGALGFENQILGSQVGDDLVDLAFVVKRLFIKVHIEMNADRTQCRLDVFENFLVREFPEMTIAGFVH